MTFLWSVLLIVALPCGLMAQEDRTEHREPPSDVSEEEDLSLAGEEPAAIDILSQDEFSGILPDDSTEIVDGGRMHQLKNGLARPGKEKARGYSVASPSSRNRRGWGGEIRSAVNRSVTGGSDDDALLLGGTDRVVSTMCWHAGHHVQGLFTVVKRPGEPLNSPTLLGSLRYAGDEFLDELIVGDYTVTAGEGLVLSRTYVAAGVPPPSRSADDLRPYRGRGGDRFFRGIAWSCRAPTLAGDVHGILFASCRSLAGTTSESGTVTSIDWAGMARTPKELAKLGAVKERLMGARIQLEGTSGNHLGLTAFSCGYDHPLALSSGFGFAGTVLRVLGCDAAVQWRAVAMFFEAAWTPSCAASCIAGMIVEPTDRTSLSVTLRSFGERYHNLHASAMGIHDDGSNEQGARISLVTAVLPECSFDGFVDVWTVPCPTSDNALAFGGMTASARLTVDLPNEFRGVIRFRMAQNPAMRRLVNADGVEAKCETIPERRAATLLGFVPLGGGLTVRTMITLTTTHYERLLCDHSAGLLSVGLLGKWKGVSCDVRCSLYGSEGTDAEAGDVEPEVGRRFTVVSSDASGGRFSAFISASLSRNLELRVKWTVSQTEWKPVAGGERVSQQWPVESAVGLEVGVEL